MSLTYRGPLLRPRPLPSATRHPANPHTIPPPPANSSGLNSPPRRPPPTPNRHTAPSSLSAPPDCRCTRHTALARPLPLAQPLARDTCTPDRPPPSSESSVTFEIDLPRASAHPAAQMFPSTTTRGELRIRAERRETKRHEGEPLQRKTRSLPQRTFPRTSGPRRSILRSTQSQRRLPGKSSSPTRSSARNSIAPSYAARTRPCCSHQTIDPEQIPPPRSPANSTANFQRHQPSEERKHRPPAG